MIDFEKELAKYGLNCESYENLLRDCSDKVHHIKDIEWNELKNKYNLNVHYDTLRKSSQFITGGVFVSEYFKWKNSRNKKTDELKYEIELDKKLDLIRKERIKLQTSNIERNRIDRNEARQELYFEYIGKAIETLPLPEFSPIIENEHTSSNNEYVLTIADVHYGASFVSQNNEYSPAIAKERFEFLQDELMHFIESHGIRKLHIVSLGDLLQGLLRVKDLKINDSSVVKATVEISRLIALFLNNVSKYVNIEYYHVPTANHTQLRPLGTKASELADEDLEYIIGRYISDLLINNDRINIHLAEDDKQYIDFTVSGYYITAIHGHQIKNIENSIRDLRDLKNSNVDYLLMGHYHGGREIPSHEMAWADSEILVSPSFVGSCPYSDSIFKGSKASVKIYGFNEIYGHIETYKIILN